MLLPEHSGHPNLRGKAKEDGLANEGEREQPGQREDQRNQVLQEVSFRREEKRERPSLPNVLGNLLG